MRQDPGASRATTSFDARAGGCGRATAKVVEQQMIWPDAQTPRDGLAIWGARSARMLDTDWMRRSGCERLGGGAPAACALTPHGDVQAVLMDIGATLGDQPERRMHAVSQGLDRVSVGTAHSQAGGQPDFEHASRQLMRSYAAHLPSSWWVAPATPHGRGFGKCRFAAQRSMRAIATSSGRSGEPGARPSGWRLRAKRGRARALLQLRPVPR